MSNDPREQPEKQFQDELEERLESLSRQIDAWVDNAQTHGDTLKQLIVEARERPFLLDGAPHAEGDKTLPGRIGDLADFARDVETSADQGKILTRLLSGASALAPRVLLFVVKGDSVKGWAGKGFHEGFIPRSLIVPLGQESVLAAAFRGCSSARQSPAKSDGNRSLAQVLGTPHEMLAIPMWVRDRVVAVLYADTMGAPWFPEALSVMVSLAALSLEALPARNKYPRPAAAFEAAGRLAAAGVPAEPPRPPMGIAERRQATPPPAVTVLDPAPPEEAEDAGADAMLVEEARRFARLLVSEIVLYNEAAIAEGRRNKDLYERLKDDIERSRRMFEQRMGPQLQDATVYFREELVCTLANGDESAISLPWA